MMKKPAVWDVRYREYEEIKDGQRIKNKTIRRKKRNFIVRYFTLIVLILVCLNIYFNLDVISDAYISEVEYLYIQYASIVAAELLSSIPILLVEFSVLILIRKCLK